MKVAKTETITGMAEIRNAHGSAAHGANAYEPLLDSRYAKTLARAMDAAWWPIVQGAPVISTS